MSGLPAKASCCARRRHAVKRQEPRVRRVVARHRSDEEGVLAEPGREARRFAAVLVLDQHLDVHHVRAGVQVFDQHVDAGGVVVLRVLTRDVQARHDEGGASERRTFDLHLVVVGRLGAEHLAERAIGDTESERGVRTELVQKHGCLIGENSEPAYIIYTK